MPAGVPAVEVVVDAEQLKDLGGVADVAGDVVKEDLKGQIVPLLTAGGAVHLGDV